MPGIGNQRNARCFLYHLLINFIIIFSFLCIILYLYDFDLPVFVANSDSWQFSLSKSPDLSPLISYVFVHTIFH